MAPTARNLNLRARQRDLKAAKLRPHTWKAARPTWF